MLVPQVAKEYQDANNPLVQWLEKMQKKLKDMETIPTDEEKIQRKIQEHDVSSPECENHPPHLCTPVWTLFLTGIYLVFSCRT